jgi:outer membrane immunogenic protein
MIARTLRRAASCATLAFGLAAAAHAQSATQDTGLYIQGGWSYYNFEANDTGYSVDTNAITARLGWQFTPMLGIEADLSAGIDEGDLDFDSSEDDLDFDANNDGDFTDIINVSGDLGLDFMAAAYGRAQIPLSDRLSLSGRVGYAYAEVNANAIGPGGVQIPLAEDAEDGFTAGAGLSYALSDNLELRADYTWFGLDNVDVNSGSVALGWKF